MNRQLKRIKTFSIEEVESLVKEDCEDFSLQNRHEKSIEIEGHQVYTRSLRYKTFIEKGYKCACCGRTGTYYALECNKVQNVNRAHFNLYSDDDVLMTKDHILPKSKGGKDCIENMQTMCSKCNSAKGSTVPDGLESMVVIKPKRINNREYFWRGNIKYSTLKKAAKAIVFGDEARIPKAKARIRDSVKNGMPYCGVVWRYGKENV